MRFFYSTLIFLQGFLFSQYSVDQEDKTFSRILFYNVENLFDAKDDEGKNDEEYLPGGIRGWNFKRMDEKIIRISKVILSAGNPEPPGIIGLCEVENRFVLERLINTTPLQSFGYKIIHKESPDSRGIDVALLYRDQVFEPIKYEYFPVTDPADPVWTTREILYFSARVNKSDTLHIFINHWPSRSGGLLETKDKRSLAANTLRRQIQLLHEQFRNPLIVLIGDFNDQPSDESIYKVLGAVKAGNREKSLLLHNLASGWSDLSYGTHKYQSQWSVFDQVIVSGSLLNKSHRIFSLSGDANIFKPSFLIQNDKTFGGIKPFRTYSGYKYIGGFSDHLPVYLDIRQK